MLTLIDPMALTWAGLALAAGAAGLLWKEAIWLYAAAFAVLVSVLAVITQH